MSEGEVLINVKAAVDDAIKGLQSLGKALDDTGTKTKEMGDKQKAASGGTMDLVKGLSGLTTGAWALYQGYDRLIDGQVGVDRAMLAAKSSANAVEDAQKRYNDVVAKFSSTSPEATASLKDLQLAQERATVSTERAQMVQDNLSEAYTGFALGVVPATITMISGLDNVTKILGFTNLGTAAHIAYASLVTAYHAIVTAAAAGPTAVLTLAQHALNAAYAANPIGFVIAALALLVGALIWAYQNVKPFHDAVNALGEYLSRVLKPIFDMINGVIHAFGNAWNWVTGQTQKANEEQLASIESRYTKMEATAKSSYDKQVAEASKAWLDKLNVEATGFDKVLEEYDKHYDTLENEVSTALDKQVQEIEKRFGDQEDVISEALNDQLDVIQAAYEDQTDAIKTEYDKQISDTESYYDELIGVVEGGLSAITDARNKDLDELELNYLQQKESADNAYAAGKMTKEEYEKKLDDLETAYRTTRQAKSQDYRIQELQYEKTHAGELEKLEADKKAALETIKKDENDKLTALENQYNLNIEKLKKTSADQIAVLEARRVAAEEIAKKAANAKIAELETQRNTDIAAIKAEMKTMADKFQAELNKMEADKAAERNGIVAKAESDKKVIEDTSHAESLTSMETYKENMRIKNEAMATKLGETWRGISTTLSGIWNGMVTVAQTIWDGILGIFSQNVPTPKMPTPPGTSTIMTSTGNVGTNVDLSAMGNEPITTITTTIPTIITPVAPPAPTSIYALNTPEARALGYKGFQHGFEGTISEPTLALIGEGGRKEDVSIRPAGSPAIPGDRIGGGAFLFSPNIYITTGPISGIEDIRQLADVIYEEISKRVRNEMKSNSFYTRGI
jgi:hypothetical protein